MPHEPEREIEKTLRDYARQRREQAGAPRDLHPATRKLLRDEAVRVHPPAARKTGSRWVWPWFAWPRLALGVGMLVLLGVTAAVYLSKSPKQTGEMRLTMNRALNAPQPAVPPPSPASVAAPAPVSMLESPAGKKIPLVTKDESADKLKASESAASGRLSFNDAEKTAPKFAPSDAPVTVTGALDGVQSPAHLGLDSRAATNQALAQALTPAAAPPPVASAPASFAFQDRLPADVNSAAAPAVQTAAFAGVASQRFYRVNAAAGEFNAAKSLVQPDVLNSFRVEQNGGQVRFIDRDGSVYAGQLQNAAMRERATQRGLSDNSDLSAGAEKESFIKGTNAKSDLSSRAAAPKPGSNGAPVFFFRVLGTNRSLNQPVVFTGEFLNAGAPIAGSLGGARDASTGTSADRGGFGGGAISTNLTSLQLLNFRVSGRAQIGTNHATDILANPAPDK